MPINGKSPLAEAFLILWYFLKMDRFAIGRFHGIFDSFADRRMRVDGVEDFVVGRFQLPAENGLRDDLGDIVADHVSAQPFAVFSVEDDFYKPFRMAGAGGFTGS